MLGHLVVLTSRKHMAWIHYIMHRVGTIDSHGDGDQQKGTTVTLVDRVPRFEAY